MDNEGPGTTVVDFPTNSTTLKDLTAEDIFKANDEAVEAVDVPEWSGRVWVRGLTGAERDAFEQSIVQGRGKNQTVNLKNFRAKLVVAAAIKGEHNKERLFGDVSHIDRLGTKSARALERVFEKAQELAGLKDEDVEQMTSDLGKDQNGSSGSD